ncbi:sulfurtransferase [Mesorhizobium sp. 2RAF21]|uniref:sulfurtransferase n=1 Tax=Mesorhizobium sp. 2RAF21 TaxID=3232995 RepID=UPI003F990546
MLKKVDLRSRHLVSAGELSEALASENPPVLLDIRFQLGGPEGLKEYLAGHIPTAVFVDLPTELAGVEKGFSGRRPLPEIHDLQRDARRWGVRENSAVVVYDNNSGQQASRAWWVLRWAGLTDVRLLDGGFAAWQAAGLQVTRDVPLPSHGDVSLSAGHLPTIDADQAAALPGEGTLLDARGASAYRGKPTEPGQPGEGHIPGAVSAPTTENLDPTTGLFASEKELRSRFETLNVTGETPLGVYCGGGVTATHQLLALATIGIDAALFPGSWSAWSSDPSRPVAQGDTA